MAFVVVHRRKFASWMQGNVVGMRNGVFFSVGHLENEGTAAFDCGFDLGSCHISMLPGLRSLGKAIFWLGVFLF